MKEFFLILFQPKSCFESLKTTSFPWGKGLLFLLFIVIINSILSFPIGKAVMNHSDIFSRMPADKAEMMKAMQEKMKYLGLFTVSILFVIKMFFYSLVLWLLSFFCKKEVKFISILSIIIVTSFVIVLGDIVNTMIIYFQGTDKVISEYTVHKSGLNILFDVSNIGAVFYTLLTYINPFQIWFIVLLIIGLKNLVGIKITNGAVITLLFWLITIAIPTLMVYMAEMAKSKMGVI